MAYFLNWFDYLFITVVLISATVGYLRGLVKEIISLGTWIVATLLALKYTYVVMPFITAIHNASIKHVAAFSILFIATLLLGSIFNIWCVKIVAHIGLRGLDRILGMTFGSLRGLLLIGVLIMFGSMTALTKQQFWQHSLLLPHLHGLVMWLQSALKYVLAIRW